MEFISEGSDGQIFAISETEVIKIFKEKSKFEHENKYKNNRCLEDTFILPKRQLQENILVYERARGELIHYLDEFDESDLKIMLDEFEKKYTDLYNFGYIFIDFRPQNIVLMQDNKTIKLVDLCGLYDLTEISSEIYEKYKHNYKSPYEIMIVKKVHEYKLKKYELPVCAHFFYYLKEFNVKYHNQEINEYNYLIALSSFPDSLLFIKKMNNLINKTYYNHDNRVSLENLQKFKLEIMKLFILNIYKIIIKRT